MSTSSMAAARVRGRTVGLAIQPRHVRWTLGCLWILDGLLQMQPYMFSHAFLAQMVGSMASDQPAPIAWSITTMVHLLAPVHVLANLLFALTQVGIGLGLLIGGRLLKPALLVSFGWTVVVWWFGEGFGMVAMGMASPLTGAPGAVLLYTAVGACLWPSDREEGDSVADLSRWGDQGGRLMWAAVWLLSAVLMARPVNTAADSLQSALVTAAGNVPAPLSGLDRALAAVAAGRGLAAAVALGLVMGAVGLGVLVDWHRNVFIWMGALLAIGIWLTTEDLGGMLTGTGTDPNTGPLLVLLGATVYRQRGQSRATAPWADLSPGARRRLLTLGLPAAVSVLFVAGAVYLLAQPNQPRSEPVSFQQNATTPHYSLLLLVAPPQAMYTRQQLRTLHPSGGEVMFSGHMVMPSGSGSMAGMNMASSTGWYHVEVHIFNRQSGHVVTTAQPAILVRDDTTGRTTVLPIVTMQGVADGASDFHYGNNVRLPAGHSFTITVTIGADRAVFHFHM